MKISFKDPLIQQWERTLKRKAPGAQVSLGDREPIFLRWLEDDPEAAKLGIADFVLRLFESSPPKRYFGLPTGKREDALVRTIARCIEKISQYEPRENATFSGWVATIGGHEIVNEFRDIGKERKWNRFAMQIQQFPHEDGSDPFENMVSPMKGPDHHVSKEERKAILISIYRKLNRRCRLVIRLRCLGKTNEEIGKVLGVDNETVGKWVYNCRLSFKKLLGESGHRLSEFGL
jgi:RNA polymerase sigma factor (sigma-70 family)